MAKQKRTSDKLPCVLLINDPVHGSIEFRSNEIYHIINTQEFQRLRKIKQMGGKCYAYPGANHTRFEHSIGVCYIACELLEHLMKYDDKTKKLVKANKKRKKIDYVKCVKLAALCHDLGHGPYSHLYDEAVKDLEFCKKEDNHKNMKHEFRSAEIFGRISGKLSALKKIHFDVTPRETEVIKGMITFSEDYKGMKKHLSKKEQYESQHDREKEIMVLKELEIPTDVVCFYEIAANGFSGIDVDKMDYFNRDGHALGLPIHFNWRRYIQTVKVLEVKPGRKHKLPYNRLCSRDKEEHRLLNFFHSRYQLYRQAINHKTVVCVSRMIKDALIAANEDLVVVASNAQRLPILEAWKNIDAFLHLTDSIEDIIMEQEFTSASSKGIIKARCIFSQIRERKFMKFLGEVKKTSCYGTCTVDLIKKECEEVLNKKRQEVDIKKTLGKRKRGIDEKERKKAKFSSDCIIHEEVSFNYSMKKENPVKKHYFYEKEGCKPYLLKDEPYKVPSETKIFVYYKLPMLTVKSSHFSTHFCLKGKEESKAGHNLQEPGDFDEDLIKSLRKKIKSIRKPS